MTRQVALSERAYAELTLNKRPGESFSDLVLRLLGSQPKDMDAFVGALGLAHQEGDDLMEQIERSRDASLEAA